VSRATTDPMTIRPYGDQDERSVLDLLTASLGPGPMGRRTADLFRWKHLENPFGRSVMLVAEETGRIVGLRAFMRWRFRAGSTSIRAVRAVDTATHPHHQGRGIFLRLTSDALALLRGDTDLVFNTPNDKSGPGYLKLGWRPVGRLTMSVRPRRLPYRRTAEPPVEAPSARDVLEDPRLPALLERAEPEPGRIATSRSCGGATARRPSTTGRSSTRRQDDSGAWPSFGSVPGAGRGRPPWPTRSSDRGIWPRPAGCSGRPLAVPRRTSWPAGSRPDRSLLGPP
jgi:GNAT superfamily N-acetyltransferase